MNKPITPAAKLHMIMELMGQEAIYDDDGNLVEEERPQLISKEKARQLLELSEQDMDDEEN